MFWPTSHLSILLTDMTNAIFYWTTPWPRSSSYTLPPPFLSVAHYHHRESWVSFAMSASTFYLGHRGGLPLSPARFNWLQWLAVITTPRYIEDKMQVVPSVCFRCCMAGKIFQCGSWQPQQFCVYTQVIHCIAWLREGLHHAKQDDRLISVSTFHLSSFPSSHLTFPCGQSSVIIIGHPAWPGQC